MTDNRTTELREKLTERGVEFTTDDFDHLLTTNWWADEIYAKYLEGTGKSYVDEDDPILKLRIKRVTPEQAISATLGKPKAKAHPYGYEPDTGAFDCTRCECGCINDISATYCNDCGGEIEVDMNAEKELYHHPRNSVFAEKHDDGSLEFGGKRYIAATLGSEREKALEDVLRDIVAGDPKCMARSCGDCEHEEDYGCGIYRRMYELGVLS